MIRLSTLADTLTLIQHGSCPTCRHSFLELPAESDDESSDGEYIPDEEDEADYLDFSDYTDADNLFPSEAEVVEEDEGVEATEESEEEGEGEPAAHEEFASAESDEEAPSDDDEEYSDAASEDEEGSEDGEALALATALAQGYAQDLRRFRPRPQVLDPEAQQLFDEERRIDMMGPHLPSDWRARQFEARLPLLPAPATRLAQEAEWRQQRLEEEAAAERDILRHIREVADDEEELAEDFADAVDAMDDESAGDEESSSGSDTFMDVYLSDSSSDQDYRPEDYMMRSDSEESDSEYMSSDFDYGADDLGGFSLRRHSSIG